MNEQAPSKVAPDADEIGAGDDVVILDEEGVIADAGVLCDIDGEDAEVRIGHALFKVVPFGEVAHPDSPAAEASRSLPLTEGERECLVNMYEKGVGVGTPGGDRIGYRLLKRGFLGVADRLPNGEGRVVSITEAGCAAIGRPGEDAFRIGEAK
jgi:hypothetical protein